MTKKQLTHLICPYCHHHFHLNKIYLQKNNHLEFGTIYCHCDEFPIISGIIYLHKNNIKNIIDALKYHRFTSALDLAFEFGHLKKIIFHFFHFLNSNLKLSIDNFINIFLISYIWNLSPSEIKYYLQRPKEIESLLFFIPLSFNQNISHSKNWLDVGPGIKTFYSQVHHLNPKIIIYSQDILLRNLYLQSLFFPEKNVIYLCSDAACGPHFKNKSLDIVTFIDSLPFIEHQQKSLQNIFSGELSSHALVFISSLVDHIYLSNCKNIFPLSISLAKSFLPSSSQVFNEIKLCQNLFKNNCLQDSILPSGSKPAFRYDLLWPHQKLPQKLIFPKNINQKDLTLWKNANITWKNKTY